MGTDHQSVQSVAGKVSCNNTALFIIIIIISNCLKRLYDKSAGLGLLVRVVSFAFCIFFTNFIIPSLLITVPCPSLHLFTEIDKLNVYYSFVA